MLLEAFPSLPPACPRYSRQIGCLGLRPTTYRRYLVPLCALVTLQIRVAFPPEEKGALLMRSRSVPVSSCSPSPFLSFIHTLTERASVFLRIQ